MVDVHRHFIITSNLLAFSFLARSSDAPQVCNSCKRKYPLATQISGCVQSRFLSLSVITVPSILVDSEPFQLFDIFVNFPMPSIDGFTSKDNIAALGSVIGTMMSLSPVPTFIDIAIYSKTTGGYTVAPYISSVCCSSIWLTYALLAGSSKSDLIPLNALSIAIYMAYCAVFVTYTDNRQEVLRTYTAALLIIASIAALATLVQSLVLIGILAIAANCLMFAAPLAIVKEVVKTKSVRYMPFLMSLMSFLCASVWLIWAIMAQDYFVLIPNALGTLFSLAQLVLYGVYWRMERNEKRRCVYSSM
jgi:solute carrier family 50 (sugar transporter)